MQLDPQTRIVVLIVAVVIFFFCLIQLPVWIAKDRKVSEAHLGTVRLLSWLSLLVGITWIVALILACVYPPAPAVAKRKSFSKSNVPSNFEITE